MNERSIQDAVNAVLVNLRPQIEAEVRKQSATRKDSTGNRMVDVVRLDAAHSSSSRDARFDEAVQKGVLAACKELGIPTTARSDEEILQEKLDSEYDEIRKMYESAWRS